MEKETLIKLLITFNISKTAIRRCKVWRVTGREVEEYKYHVFAENEGRMEL